MSSKLFFFSILFCVSLFDPTNGQEKPTHHSDTGSKTPASAIKNQISNAIASLEKQLTPAQRLRILSEARIYAEKLEGTERDEAIFRIANQYRQSKLTNDAKTLFKSVVEKSNDPEFKIRSGMAIAEIEFLKEQNLKQAIETLENSLTTAQSSGRDEMSAMVLIRTGSYYFIDEQFDRMIEVFDEFNALPANVKSKFPREHLKANLYAGRTLSQKNDTRAKRYFSNVQSILKDAKADTFALDLVLSLALETSNLGKRWNSPERIKKLKQLFDDNKNETEPGICFIGNEIFWAYFLDREKEWEQFQNFQHNFSSLLTKHSQSDPKLVPLEIQIIGAFAFACEGKDKPFDRDKMLKRLDEIKSKIKRLDERLPNGIDRNERKAFSSSIRGGLVDVLKFNPAKMKKIPAVIEPTPTAKPDEKRK